MISIGFAQATIIDEFPLRIEPTVTNQIGIDQYIDWELTEITPTLWLMRGRVDNVLWNDFWTIRNLQANRNEWNAFVNSYFPGYTVNDIRDQLRSFNQYPFSNTSEATIQLSDWTMNASEGTIELSITFPTGLRAGHTFKTGWNSTTISGSVATNGEWLFQRGGVYSENLDRWYFCFVNNAQDPVIYSTNSTLGNLTTGATLMTTTTNVELFECLIDEPNSTSSYVHAVYDQNNVHTMRYRMINLTNTSPFVSLNTEQIVYTSADTLDDFETFSLEQRTSDRCLYIAADFEDDSLATADEFQQLFFRENGTSPYACADGIWNQTMIYGGAPLTVQTDAGYTAVAPAGVRLLSDDNALVTWLDTDTAGGMQLKARMYNESTNSFTTQRTINSDVEGGSSQFFATFATTGNDAAIYYLPDGVDDITLSILNAVTGIQTNVTGVQNNSRLAMSATNQTTFAVTKDNLNGTRLVSLVSVVGNVSEYNMTNASSVTSTAYNNSVYAGNIDPPGVSITTLTGQRYLFASFDSENCNLLFGGQFIANTNYYNVVSDLIPTGTCSSPPPANNTCSGSSDCTFTCDTTVSSAEDAGGFDIYTTGTGTLTVNARISDYDNFYMDSDCRVFVNTNSGGRIERR